MDLESFVREHQFVAPEGHSVPDSVNTCTFTCPICGMEHLPREDLLAHVDEKHSSEPPSSLQRPCPICCTLPIGGTTDRYRDVVAHLKERHRFDYDHFTDFEESEEEMIQRAIAQSLRDL